MPGKLTKEDKEFVKNQVLLIKERLKDPDSAKFRNTFIVRVQGQALLCGEVNSKNSFGGYTGFTRFMMGMTEISDKAWSENCGVKEMDYTIK